MSDATMKVLESTMDEANLAKLLALDNPKLNAFVADAIALCKPAAVHVGTDSDADAEATRQMALDQGEENPLATDGHTVHFDGITDQGRDPGATRYLLPEGVDLGQRVKGIPRAKGLAEIRGYLDGAMAGETMLVRFFCLGPVGSQFSIPCAQITDSAYVAHSEDMLYRRGYEQFRRIAGSGDFFRFLHSAGRLDERHNSADTDKRRVYIDIAEDMVYSSNTQYAGNTVGLKKLALRLAIRKGDQEGWLAEHMFVVGIHGPHGRKTYFCGAFPSACGKTSTAMLPGENIIGDDIAYFRHIHGRFRAANVERGIFGIIQDVSPAGDPLIHDVLTRPGEVIFSNVLIRDGMPYWLGMGRELPESGENFSGPWKKGNKDAEGETIPPAHKNARYTIRLEVLANVDENLNDPHGVPVGAIVYGGRDSDTSVPVTQSFDWTHGIVTMGASIESETTAATVGKQGVRTFNIMANMDFVAIPLGRYIQNNLDFGNHLASPPAVFGVNYFLRKGGKPDGAYLNGMLDKAVWIKWAELRVHGDGEAIEGPTGFLPKYEDLKRLFKGVLKKDYTAEQYAEQFTIRVPELLAKIDRIVGIYKEVADTPKVVFEALAAQRARLVALQAAKGDYVKPTEL